MLPPRTNAGVKQMNATISSGENIAFAKEVRRVNQKPDIVAPGYALKLWNWMIGQGAEAMCKGRMQWGKLTYDFTRVGKMVKVEVVTLPEMEVPL